LITPPSRVDLRTSLTPNGAGARSLAKAPCDFERAMCAGRRHRVLFKEGAEPQPPPPPLSQIAALLRLPTAQVADISTQRTNWFSTAPTVQSASSTKRTAALAGAPRCTPRPAEVSLSARPLRLRLARHQPRVASSRNTIGEGGPPGLVELRPTRLAGPQHRPTIDAASHFPATFLAFLSRFAGEGLSKDARHGALTAMAANGSSPIAIMTTAGHGSLETTKRYLHLADTVFREDAEKLEFSLGLSTPASTHLSEPHSISDDPRDAPRPELSRGD